MRDSRELIQAGMREDEFPRTLQVLRSGLEEEVFPGAVVGLWRATDPNRIFVAAVGQRRIVPSSLPMLTSTAFDLASVTKVFATATLAAMLVDRRWINWDTRVRSILPGYPHSGIELRHLLSHTAGLPACEPLWEQMRERFSPPGLEEASVAERQAEMRKLVFEVGPEAAPEARAVYSDISFLLLGFALEEVTGIPLDKAVRRLLWEPMGVGSAFYTRVTRAPVSSKLESVAATESCPWRGAVLQGQVHDDNCWAMGGYGGHAGAFSDVAGVLHFVRVLFSGFLTRETLRAVWSRASRPQGCERTLGWDTPSGAEPAAGRLFSPVSVGHLGFTGTSLWIDIEAELAVTLLTNRVHPSRENVRIKAFRPRFHEALRQDLADRKTDGRV